jgi:hypothetical protein
MVFQIPNCLLAFDIRLIAPGWHISEYYRREGLMITWFK